MRLEISPSSWTAKSRRKVSTLSPAKKKGGETRKGKDSFYNEIAPKDGSEKTWLH